MTLTQNLIENFSNKSKTYKDNFFHFSHGERQWEIGLAYTFDRAAKTLDGVVQYLQHPTFDFAAITIFALKDVRDARRAQTLLEKSFDFDEYLDEPREYVEGWPSDVPELSFADKIKIVGRAKQEAEADLKIIGLRAFQRATQKTHQWGERVYAGGLGATSISQPTYRSDRQVADILVQNSVYTESENRRELASFALFALGTVGVPLALVAHHYLTQAPDDGVDKTPPPISAPVVAP